MLKSVLILAAALATVPAFAQSPALAFSGLFAGVAAGWQQDRQSFDVAGLGGGRSSGLALGGQIGYDFRLSTTIVAGGELALTGRSGGGVLDFGGGVYRLSPGRYGTATARIGYLRTPIDLFYLRGGYADAGYTIDGTAGGRVKADRNGFTIGAGYERMLADKVSARIEYGYADLGSDKFFGGIAGPNGTAALTYRRHTVLIGANYHF